MKKRVYTSDALKALGELVIQEQDMDLKPATIEYLLVSPMISKTTVARCIRCSDELSYFSEADYIIEFSEDLWNVLNDDTKKVVMHHELLHVNPVYNEKKGEWTMKLQPHDFEDFFQIVNMYGVNWYKNMQVQAGSIRDLTPEQTDVVSV